MTSEATNGKRYSWPQVGAISSFVGLLALVGGYVTGYRTLANDVARIEEKMSRIEAQIAAISREADADRLVMNTLGGDLRWIKEGVGELRLTLIPKR